MERGGYNYNLRFHEEISSIKNADFNYISSKDWFEADDMPYSVFVITNLNKVFNKIKHALFECSETFKIIGQSANTIVGKSLIEELSPQIVIIRQNMSFWSGLNLLQEGRATDYETQFILLIDDDNIQEYQHVQHGKISAVLPEYSFTMTDLIEALKKAGSDWERNCSEKNYPNKGFAIGKAPLLSEIVNGLLPALDSPYITDDFQNIIFVQPSDLVWVAVASPESCFHESFYQYYSKLPALFSKLYQALNKYADTLACIWQEKNLCIIMKGDAALEDAEWAGIHSQINAVMDSLELPHFVLEVFSSRVGILDIYEACKKLKKLNEYRFFVSDIPILKWEWIAQNKGTFEREEIVDKINSLSVAVNRQDERCLYKAIDELYSAISKTLSFEVFSLAWTHLLFQYNYLVEIYNLTEGKYISEVLHSSFHSLQQYRQLSIDIFDRLIQNIKSSSQNKHPVIQSAVSYIKDNLSQDITLSAIAKEVFVSTAYLSRLFKQKTGLGFAEYVNQIRINEIKKLLGTNAKISDIGPMVGISNTKYMSQLFRKHEGMSPSQFRKQIKREVL